MAEEAVVWFIWSPIEFYLYTLWQLELREVVRESSVPWHVEAHWDKVSLYWEYGVKGSSEAPICCDGRSDSWCVDEAIGQSEVWVLQGEAWCSRDRGSLQGEMMRPRAILSWWEDLVPSMSDVSAEPFWCDCGIGSYMIRYKGYCHYWNGAAWWGTRKTQSRTEGRSDMTVRCVLTWSDMSAWLFCCDRGMCSPLIRCKGWIHSVMTKGLGSSHVRYEC